jgi:trans-aconitate methyltransferase
MFPSDVLSAQVAEVLADVSASALRDWTPEHDARLDAIIEAQPVGGMLHVQTPLLSNTEFRRKLRASARRVHRYIRVRDLADGVAILITASYR